MENKKTTSKKTSDRKLKVRGGKKLAEEIVDATNIHERKRVENPLKRAIKLNQLPWTEKQKEFFKIALHPSTKIVFVNGPAGTAKTLLSTY